jgi:hypothetical protein
MYIVMYLHFVWGVVLYFWPRDPIGLHTYFSYILYIFFIPGVSSYAQIHFHCFIYSHIIGVTNQCGNHLVTLCTAKFQIYRLVLGALWQHFRCRENFTYISHFSFSIWVMFGGWFLYIYTSILIFFYLFDTFRFRKS